MVEIRLLGRFAVRSGGEEVPLGAFGGRLPRVLVRLLATRRGEFMSRDVLAEALWPGRLPADPAANLQVLVNRARRALGDPSLILTGPGGYALAARGACAVDGERFVALVSDGHAHLADGHAGAALRDFQAALRTWGDPLAEDAYEDWAQPYRSAMCLAHLEALEDGARAALALRDPAQAVALAEQAAGREPLREGATLLLAQALAGVGDAAAALRALDGFRRRLADELGLDPGPEFVTLERRLLSGEPLGPTTHRPEGRPAPVAFSDLAFVGRDAELLVVTETLTASSPGVVLVTGEAGSGKSRLLAEVAARESRPVLMARAFLAERDEAWSLARSILREAVAFDLDVVRTLPERVAAALAAVLPELAELRPIETGAPLDGESRRALAIEAGIRVVEATLGKGVLLFADDLQWADATSLQMLAVAIARVPRFGAVLAYRPDDALAHPPAAAFLDAVHGQGPAVRSVALAPLSREALGTLVADEGLADVLAGETDGTPLAVAEVVRSLAARGMVEPGTDGRWQARHATAVDAAVDSARAGQSRAIAGRVARQSGAGKEILALLALLGRETPARTLAAAAGQEQAGVLDVLDGLARAGLARLGEGGWAPAHDLVGEIVADGLEAGRRAKIHLTLARALADGGDRAEIARHLSGGGDRVAAAEAYAAAARERQEHHAAAEAAALATEGLSLDPGPAVRRELLRVRAEGRAVIGDRPGAREDLRSALPTEPPGPERSLVLTRMAMLTMADDLAGAADLVDMALTDAGAEPGARAEALTVGAFVDLSSGRLDRSDARSTQALALFEQLGDGLGTARILDARGAQLFLGGRLVEGEQTTGRAAQLYLDSGNLALVGLLWCYRSWALGWMARPQEALADADRALELERSLGQTEGEAMALVMGGRALADLGQAVKGRRRIEDARAVLGRLGVREWEAGCLYFLAYIAEATGDEERAETLLREAVEVATASPFPGSVAAARLAAVRLVRGDLADAEAWARRATAPGMLPVGRLEADLVLAEIALQRGDPDAPAMMADALQRASSGGWVASPTVRRVAALAAADQSAGEAAAADRERATFMFTDIVGSTNLVEMLGDDAWGHLLRWHDDTLRLLFRAHSGREVNRIGDGFFVAFADPRSAVACAIAIQRALDQHRRTHGFSPGIRIGLHEAEATRRGGDYEGKGVHVAARIAALAGGGEILASREAVGALPDLATSPPRPATLKGLSEPIEVVAVDWR